MWLDISMWLDFGMLATALGWAERNQTLDFLNPLLEAHLGGCALYLVNKQVLGPINYT